MTTINSQEDFLRALTDNPQWKAAVRAQILGEELLQLPVRFDAFVERITLFIAEMTAFVADQKQFNAGMTLFVANQEQFNAEQRQFNANQEQFNADQNANQEQFNADQRQFNAGMTLFVANQEQFNARTDAHFARIDRRFDTISNDIAQVKGGHARAVVVDNAAVIALDMGFQYTRTLSRLELALMAQRARGGDIPSNELESFRNADLIIEAKDGAEIHYITVEASFTTDYRDTVRAQRNARFLTRFTGYPAHAAIASVRNDHAVEAQIASGAIHWHRIAQRDLDPQ